MKILFICGSPRRNGNTADVMRKVADKLADRHDVVFRHLADLPVHGCIGCNRCRENLEEPGCVQRDETARLLEEILDADVVIYGSPLYGHTFTPELNALMNRHFAFLKYEENDDPWSPNRIEPFSLVEGKEVGLVVTCQGPIENNAELLLMQFDRFCAPLQLNPFGKYVFPWAPADQEERNWDAAGVERVTDDIDQLTEYFPG